MNEGPNQFMAHAHVAKDLTEQRTLRDWFAGMALQGLCTSMKDEGENEKCLSYWALQYSIAAYTYADAMLTERLKGEQK